jgi:hypothetical protein
MASILLMAGSFSPNESAFVHSRARGVEDLGLDLAEHGENGCIV